MTQYWQSATDITGSREASASKWVMPSRTRTQVGCILGSAPRTASTNILLDWRIGQARAHNPLMRLHRVGAIETEMRGHVEERVVSTMRNAGFERGRAAKDNN